jgi:hypothetical protein
MEESLENGRRGPRSADSDIGEVSREFERSRREVGRSVRQAKEKLSDAYEKTSEAASRAYQEAITSASENPGLSALVCFGVGVSVGLWLASMTRSRSFRDRIVPVLATAVADAVKEFADGAR